MPAKGCVPELSGNPAARLRCALLPLPQVWPFRPRRQKKYIFHCGGFAAAMKNIFFLFPLARQRRVQNLLFPSLSQKAKLQERWEIMGVWGAAASPPPPLLHSTGLAACATLFQMLAPLGTWWRRLLACVNRPGGLRYVFSTRIRSGPCPFSAEKECLPPR